MRFLSLQGCVPHENDCKREIVCVTVGAGTWFLVATISVCGCNEGHKHCADAEVGAWLCVRAGSLQKC